MRIAELAVHQVRMPLKKAIKHASHTRTETDNIVVRIVLSDHTVGYGEGVPRDYVTGETIDSSIERLKQADLKSQLQACDTFDKAIQMAERLQLPIDADDDRKINGNAARCALELAVLDAYSRSFGENLFNVTRKLTPDLFQSADNVRYSAIIASAKGLKLWFAATAYKLYGFQQVKVKVGIPGYDDVKRISTVRKRLGQKADIRIDANEAWSPEEAASKISELEAFRLTSIEQPMLHENINDYAALRKRIKTPLMLDESFCGMVDAQRAAENGYCDLFNIRLSKCGGFIPSLRLTQFAKSRNIGYQLGCQVGESAILSGAGRMFATSVQGIRYFEGSYDRHLVKESLGKDDITFGKGGLAPMLAGCGVGVRIDDEKLQQLTVRKEVLIG